MKLFNFCINNYFDFATTIGEYDLDLERFVRWYLSLSFDIDFLRFFTLLSDDELRLLLSRFDDDDEI